jgi:hypothetical protein
MDETRKPNEAGNLPFQPPHWHRAEAESTSGFLAMRLVLPTTGYTIEMIRPDMMVGRHTEADIRLPLPDISRRHCRFIFADGVWQVVDLGSMNGVHVNGTRVPRAVLQDRDVIGIGGFNFEVELGGEVQPGIAANEEARAAGAVLQSIVKALPDYVPPPVEGPQRRAS